MKKTKLSVKALLAVLFMLMTPVLVYAMDFKEVPVTIDGKANEVEITDGVLCSFTPATDGTISISCISNETMGYISLQKFYNGGNSFVTWIDSGNIKPGTPATKDFHVIGGTKYAIEIKGDSDDTTTQTATIVMTLKADQNITNITFGKAEYQVENGERFDLNDMKIFPDNAVNKDIEWEYDKDGMYHYQNTSFLAREPGVYTVTAKAAKGDAKASVKVTILPKQISYVRQDTLKTTQKQIIVEWNDSNEKNIAGYNVYLYDTAKKKWKLCGTTKQNRLKVKGFKQEKKYKFRVASFIKNGQTKIEGVPSKITNLYTAPKKISATTITSIKTFGGDNSKNYVRVSWKKVKGASGYKVYGRTAGGQFKLLTSIPNTTGEFYAGRGYTYDFKVVAYRTKHQVSTDAKPSAVKSYTSKLY